MGIIWKKTLPIVPVTQITSDRFCAVELLSPGIDDDIDIDIEKIEGALTMLKTNKSGGVERFKYGGEHLKLWLKKIFNRILALEDTPLCMKDGLVIPV